MTRDKHFQRRMVISKFNNRPPFDLKKKEGFIFSGSTVDINTGNNQRRYRKSLENVKLTYKNIIQQLDEIQLDQDQFNSKNANKNKNIIPKIIECFKKVTPKRQSSLFRRDSSIQTLFRNNSLNFGKHIPKHKIMKNLLQDFYSESKVINNSYQMVDTIPSKDINSNCIKMKNLKVKVDKSTSTTGILWPVVQRPNRSQHPLNFDQKVPLNKNNISNRSKIPQRKKPSEEKDKNEPKTSTNTTDTKSSALTSELEYLPTKEVSVSGNETIKTMPRTNTYVIESENKKHDIENNGKKKERSFVQAQVDKLNHINGGKYVQRQPKGVRNCNLEMMNRNMNQNYISMMSSAKRNIPQIETKMKQKTEYFSTDNYDWSDNTLENKIEIKFPKETRNAMENLITNSRKFMRSPLAKYLKTQELQPAIQRSRRIENRKTISCPSYKRLNRLPCAKNLLCDRGVHEGPCVNLVKGSRGAERHVKNWKSSGFIK